MLSSSQALRCPLVWGKHLVFWTQHKESAISGERERFRSFDVVRRRSAAPIKLFGRTRRMQRNGNLHRARTDRDGLFSRHMERLHMPWPDSLSRTPQLGSLSADRKPQHTLAGASECNKLASVTNQVCAVATGTLRTRLR
jgi:hypothetical protein